MAPPQLGGCAVPALPARLLLLLLLLWPPLTPGTTCPTPTSVEHAEIRVKSYSVSSRERYVCNSGFKRKAGTSTLTECVLNKTTNVAHWTTPSLKCIRDPTLAHQKPVPPSTVVTPRVTPEPKSPSPPGKGLSPHSSKMMTVAISTPVAVGFVAFVVLLIWYLRQRQTSQLPGIEMETMEAMPMTASPAAGDVYREVNNSRGPENLVPDALRLLKESQERQKILSP